MTWQNPLAFFLLIPILLILLYLFVRPVKRVAFQWSSLNILENVTSTPRVLFQWIPFFLQVISLLLVVFALARPQSTNVIQKKSLKGIDMMIVLDISFSMMAEDMRPSTRLNAAKTVIKNFVNQLVSDRVGLILFSGESYTKVPLTLDYVLFQNEVSKVKTLSEIQQGTAIGVAMANAVARLRHSQSKSRVMILLTDGENNAGGISPETAIAIAKQYNIKIYSIGVGSDGMAKIPIKKKDILGRERTTYARIETKINKQLLNQISESTGGKFYMANQLSDLQSVFDEISNLEKTPLQVTHWTKKEEKFQEFLKPAVIFYLLSIFLSITVFGKTV